MRTVIWKHPIEIIDREPPSVVRVQWPVGACVLAVADVDDHLVMWTEHIVGGTLTEERTFVIAATGSEVDSSLVHVGTAVGERLVWHVYEQVAPSRDVTLTARTLAKRWLGDFAGLPDPDRLVD